TQSTPSPLPSIADVVEKVTPAVVYISVEYIEFSFFTQYLRTKSGSGVLLRSDGYILTNNHVVEDARNIEVLLPDDDHTYQAELIGADPLSDLAVIKIEGQNFPTVSFADTSKLRIGDWVIALGNALGLEGGPSVTIGIVSNLERSFTLEESTFYDVIQTDAAINPGNSGGPLVNLEGKVVGINSAIIYTAQNIGFAINANTARRVYEDLVQYGRVTRPYLGVTLRTVTPALATELGLSRNKGVLVWYIAPGGPSAEAGLKTEDVITHFQGQEVSEASQLIKLLWEYDVGDRVGITFWRGEEQHEVWVTLAERPEGL
ncbi:MAG: PDZ domain-containing protein, partial [Dehalococcoidia bacterium]